MKVIVFLITLIAASPLHAQCMSRNTASIESALYIVKSCQSAETYIQISLNKELENYPESEIDLTPYVKKSIGKMKELLEKNDKALEIHPYNNSAKAFLRENFEYWHFSGNCDDVPHNVPVQLKINIYCSDAGLTKYLYLSDISVGKIKQ